MLDTLTLPDRTVRAGGFLAAAVALGGLGPSTRVAFRDADGALHAPDGATPCRVFGAIESATAADLLDRVGDGSTLVCGCFTCDLDDPEAPESVIDWAWDILAVDRLNHTGEPAADRVHLLRYLTSLPVHVDDRARGFLDQVRRIGDEKVADLTASDRWRREVVAATERAHARHRTVQAQRPGSLDPAPGTSWFPPAGIDPFPAPDGGTDETRVAAYDAVAAGPHVWVRAAHDPDAVFGYRYATWCDTTLQVAKVPMAFWTQVAPWNGDRLLCTDTGQDAALVSRAAALRPGSDHVTDLVDALHAAVGT